MTTTATHLITCAVHWRDLTDTLGQPTIHGGFGIDWTDLCNDTQPSDHTPTPFDLRQHEMRDLRDQGPKPAALWTAHTINPGSYL